MRSATRSAAAAARLAAQAIAASHPLAPRIIVDSPRAATSPPSKENYPSKTVEMRGSFDRVAASGRSTRQGGQRLDIGPLAGERHPCVARILCGADILEEERVRDALREALRAHARFLRA